MRCLLHELSSRDRNVFGANMVGGQDPNVAFFLQSLDVNHQNGRAGWNRRWPAKDDEFGSDLS